MRPSARLGENLVRFFFAFQVSGLTTSESEGNKNEQLQNPPKTAREVQRFAQAYGVKYATFAEQRGSVPEKKAATDKVEKAEADLSDAVKKAQDTKVEVAKQAVAAATLTECLAARLKAEAARQEQPASCWKLPATSPATCCAGYAHIRCGSAGCTAQPPAEPRVLPRGEPVPTASRSSANC